MPARVAKKYQVRWSNTMRIWKSSFMATLYAYGLHTEAVRIDNEEMTSIYKEHLDVVISKMEGELQTHIISGEQNVGQILNTLKQMIDISDQSDEEMYILWE